MLEPHRLNPDRYGRSVHVDRRLAEDRIVRELHERVSPLVEREHIALDVQAGSGPDDQSPLVVGTRWGAPWATTLFTFTAEIPSSWAEQRVEAVIDLGFHRDSAGFQCEGLIIDELGRPIQGIHPRRTNYAVPAEPGPISIRLEAASNPSFRQFRPSPLGSPDTAGEQPLYRFKRADLVLVDTQAEALLHDLEVLDGLMRALGENDPRRRRLLKTITTALDACPDVSQARAVLEPALAATNGASSHRIIATGHAHIDTAWLWPMRESVRKCTRTFASAVGLMDTWPEYRFTCSQAQQYEWIEEQQPELFERIRVKVKGGQWIPVGGMWVEPDMNLPSGESLVRQIVHGQRYFEQRFGRRCTEVWIPDVFGYPASLPQVFAAGGMRRFVTQKLSWNTTNRFPHHTFWWEGLDGTRVLTHFPPVDTYNAEITPAETVGSASRFLDTAWSDWSLMPFGHGDGGGGPTREMLERARRLADLAGSPQVSIGTPTEFFEHIEREAFHGAPVPTWRGELYFETHRGTLTSQLRTKAGNRLCERLLREVELWSATLGRRPDIDRIWRDVLTQQFHDILPGSSIAWVHADAERIHSEAAATLEGLLCDLFDELIPEGPHLINAGGVDRDEVVPVDADVCAQIELGATSQKLSDGQVAIRAHAPANGIAALVTVAATDRVVVTNRSMANHHVVVSWDENGNLTSIIDIASARELLPVGARAAVLELSRDQPVKYDAWDLESWTPDAAIELLAADDVVVTDSGPLIGRVQVRRSFGPSSAVITYTLSAGRARLDIGVDLDWQHDEHLLSMSFPLDVRADTAACDIQFGNVRRPTHRSTSWDAAKFEVCAHRFVDVSEPSFGVAILNDGRYGHGLFDGRVRVSLARSARYPDPNADRGQHSVTLAVFAHSGGLADVIAEAQRFTMPLRVASGSATCAAQSPLVRVIGGSAEIDAIKLADDDSGDIVVRLHEAAGDRTRVSVHCDRPIASASLCDLLEDPHAGLEVGDGICAFTMQPFELVTLRLARRSAL